MPGARPLLAAPCEQMKLSTKAERRIEKKVRLYYPDSIFTSQELLTGFAGDNSSFNFRSGRNIRDWFIALI